MRKYEQYKATQYEWLGDMPAHWKLQRAKGLFQKEKRQVRSIDDVVTCFRDGCVTLRKNRRTTGFTEALQENGYQGIRQGDLVIHVMDAFAGSIGVSDSDGKGSPVYSVCTPISKEINQFYYAYLLREMARTGYIKSLAKGIRERSTDFRFETFKAQVLPVPPLDEQNQIVRYLDWKVAEINALIGIRYKEIQKLEELKDQIIDKAVIHGLRSETMTHTYDDRWGIAYPSNWELVRLRNLFTLRKGLSITKSNLEPTGIPVISYGQVHSKKNSMVGLNDELFKFVNPSYLQTDASSLVEMGDFIFADTSEDLKGSGNCAYVDTDKKIFAGYHSIIVHRKDQADNKYFAYLFKSPTWRHQIRKKMNGVKAYSITQQILKDAFLLVPSQEEQREIVRHLDKICLKIDFLIESTHKKITELTDMKSVIASDVVTGKLDVRNIAVPEYEQVEDIVETDFEDDELQEQEA